MSSTLDKNGKAISKLFEKVLLHLGEDTLREGLLKTPDRVAKSLQFLTHGHNLDPAAILKSAMFKDDYQQMVIVKDIELYSLCEHHLLPFFGKAHVAYIPNGHIVGLSKIPRVVDAFSRRLQVQERLTRIFVRSYQKRIYFTYFSQGSLELINSIDYKQ